MAFRVQGGRIEVRGSDGDSIFLDGAMDGIWRHYTPRVFVHESVIEFELEDFDWFSEEHLVYTESDDLLIGSNKRFFHCRMLESNCEHEVIYGTNGGPNTQRGRIYVVVLDQSHFPYEYGCDSCYQLFPEPLRQIGGEDLCENCL